MCARAQKPCLHWSCCLSQHQPVSASIICLCHQHTRERGTAQICEDARTHTHTRTHTLTHRRSSRLRVGWGNCPSVWGDLPAIQIGLSGDEVQQRDRKQGLHGDMTAKLHTSISAYLCPPPVWARCMCVRKVWGCVYLGCGRSVLLCMTHFVCCAMCPHVCVCVCLGVNTPASLFLFSPCYHHDNLLTPAQPHTANISLPSPSDMFVFLTPSPRPLSPSLRLSLIYLYFILHLHLSSPVSPSLALSPSLTFSISPVMSTCYPHLKEFFLPDCRLCRKSIFYLHCSMSFTSVLYSLLPADCVSLLISVRNFPFSLPELLYPPSQSFPSY